jgi:hypothetical protein
MGERASFDAVPRSSRRSSRPRPVTAARACSALLLIAACSQGPSRASIGPQGGIVSSDDDGLTIVLWPGALGRYEDFEIVPSQMAPESFGQAYRVRPNVNLAVGAEIILRGDLPNTVSKTRIGSLDAADVADGDIEWTHLPYLSQSVDEKASTVHSHDSEIALYYAILDDGVPGSDESTSDDGSTTDVDPTAEPTTSYDRDIAPLWVTACATPNCHGTPASGGLTLLGDSYDALVDAGAASNGAYTRVIPGDPDGSLLIQKLEGTPPGDAGGPMPPLGGFPAASIALVRTWIVEGCPP